MDVLSVIVADSIHIHTNYHLYHIVTSHRYLKTIVNYHEIQHIKNKPTYLYVIVHNVVYTCMSRHFSKLYHFNIIINYVISILKTRKIVLRNQATRTTKTTKSLMLAHQWYFTAILRSPALLSIDVYITALQDTLCRKTLSD